jgi:hypothetical protein
LTNPNDPNLLSDLLLDSLRGELSPDEARRLEACLAQDGDLRRERDRLAAFLGAAGSAHALALDPKAGERTAARVLDRVRREEARSARAAATPAPRRRPIFWARLLAVSVAVHVVVLGVLGTRREAPRAPTGGPADVPFTSVAAAPDAADEGFLVPHRPGRSRHGRGGPLWCSDRDEPLPIEEPAHPDRPAAGRHARAVRLLVRARARHVRAHERPDEAPHRDARRDPGTLERVQRGLEALAARQGVDGSFCSRRRRSAAARSTGDVRTTATVLLAFLGDGSLEPQRHAPRRGGPGHRVAAFARAHHHRPGRPLLACLALAEDLCSRAGR